MRDTHRVRNELGYRDLIPADEAMRRTVDWLVENQPKRGDEADLQLGDPFDYAREDKLINEWTEWRNRISPMDYPVLPPAHMYRHPKRPNEEWKRPAHWQPGRGDHPPEK